jgi:hypothetical protein
MSEFKCWLAGAVLLALTIAPDANAGIFNATYKRSDGYFLPNFVSGSAPRLTIMRGFCYEFQLNGDFIDLTEKIATSSTGIRSLTRKGTKSGAENHVNGRAIGQLTISFCVNSTTSGDKTIRVLNFGGGEFDHLTLSVRDGGQWTSFAQSMSPVRVNIPIQFTVHGSDLADATIEGAGVHRVNAPSDLNRADELRMTLVFDANVGSQTSNQVLFLRRFSGGTGSAITDPGMVRNPSGNAGMIVAVSGSAPVVGTVTPPRPLLIGELAPPPTAPTTDQLVLHAVLGRSLRHVAAFRKIDETFCQGFPQPPAGGATERNITVPTWSLSLSNPTAGAYALGGSVTLTGPQPAPPVIQLGTINAHASIAVPFSRPTSISRAILILPTTSLAIKQAYGGRSAIGCYQAQMAANNPRNWVDPPFAMTLFDPAGAQVHVVRF